MPLRDLITTHDQCFPAGSGWPHHTCPQLIRIPRDSCRPGIQNVIKKVKEIYSLHMRSKLHAWIGNISSIYQPPFHPETQGHHLQRKIIRYKDSMKKNHVDILPAVWYIFAVSYAKADIRVLVCFCSMALAIVTVSRIFHRSVYAIQSHLQTFLSFSCALVNVCIEDPAIQICAFLRNFN
jgi:hypothetical protein